MTDDSILRRIYDEQSRANPYPLFAELLRTPVSWQADGPDPAGSYVVSTYREIAALLHDPRISSDLRNCRQTGPRTEFDSHRFINLDPPEHDRLRRLAMRHFGPPERADYVETLRPQIERIAARLIDELAGAGRIDVVSRIAYPLPVTVICGILGVPLEDQSQFRVWVDMLVQNLGAQTPDVRARRERASRELHEYMSRLIGRLRESPGDDVLSRIATDHGPEGPMDDPALVTTAVLLLVAGHETTVNLIANGVLTLLRHPSVLARLRDEPDFATGVVEELLRYEPPVQLLSNRTALEPIEIAGTTIPKGVLVTLAVRPRRAPS